MWSSVAVAVTLLGLAPAQAEGVKLTNVRLLYSNLGMERPDAKFQPGDFLAVALDIENLTPDAKTGKIAYKYTFAINDSKGKLVIEEEQPAESLDALGGNRLPAFFGYGIATDQRPGKYVFKLTVTDKVAKKAKPVSITREFHVLKKQFGFVRIVIPAVGFVGQPFAINYTITGFERDGKNVPDFSAGLSIKDAAGKPTLVKAPTTRIPKDLPEEVKPEEVPGLVPMNYPFTLNRAGQFTILLKATDHKGKKTVELTYVLTVIDPRKYETNKSGSGRE